MVVGLHILRGEVKKNCLTQHVLIQPWAMSVRRKVPEWKSGRGAPGIVSGAASGHCPVSLRKTSLLGGHTRHLSSS